MTVTVPRATGTPSFLAAHWRPQQLAHSEARAARTVTRRPGDRIIIGGLQFADFKLPWPLPGPTDSDSEVSSWATVTVELELAKFKF